MLSCHLVGRFIGVSRRDKPGVLLLPEPRWHSWTSYISILISPETGAYSAFEIGFCDKNLARTRSLDTFWRGQAVGQVIARLAIGLHPLLFS
jgi:hypothetical protein